MIDRTEQDWLVELREPSGRFRRIGVTPTVDEAGAVERAVRSLWMAFAGKRGMVRNPMSFEEHVSKTKVLKVRRRCEV